ncbi:MAG: HAD family hydrolase [Bdellovibrionota bacterium]
MNGVLLDIDGTLIDSNEAHARAWTEALAEAGVPAEYAAVREKIGEGGDHLLSELTGISFDSELGMKIRERRGEIFRLDFLPRLRALPGTRALLELFRDRGLRFAAATSGSRREAEALLRQARLDDLIQNYATADDAPSTKPDPAILEVALRYIGLPAKQVIMLGDTPYDVQAATRARIPIVAFTCGGWPAEALKGAVAVYQGPWELLAAFERSPFAQRQFAA